MTAADLLREVETRQISLTPVFDGKLWSASVDIKGSGHNRKRALRSVSAQASTPTADEEAYR